MTTVVSQDFMVGLYNVKTKKFEHVKKHKDYSSATNGWMLEVKEVINRGLNVELIDHEMAYRLMCEATISVPSGPRTIGVGQYYAMLHY